VSKLNKKKIVGGISEPTKDAESCGFFYSKDLRQEIDLKSEPK
jgi:hypothetical protein